MIHFYVVVWQPQIITVVLKVHMHCEACAQEIKKRILRMKGLSFFFLKEKLILRFMQFWLLVVIMISSTKMKKL